MRKYIILEIHRVSYIIENDIYHKKLSNYQF